MKMLTMKENQYFNTNRYALVILNALEDILGKNGVNTILNLSNLSDLINNYPPDNTEKEFNFSDLAAINLAMENIYGLRGSRGLAQRAGRALFRDAYDRYSALAGIGDLAIKVLPMNTKVRIGLNALAKLYTNYSDQYTTVSEREDTFLYSIHRCPVCWGRSGENKPVCFLYVGLLQEGLRFISNGKEFRVYESKCIAIGDQVCEYVIEKNPMN